MVRTRLSQKVMRYESLPQKRLPLATFSITLDTIVVLPPRPSHRPIQHIMLNNKHRIEKQTNTRQTKFARIVRQRSRHSCPTTTIAAGCVRIN